MAAPKRAKTFEDLSLSNRNKEDQGEHAALALVSAGTEEESLAHPKNLPAPKRAKTFEDMGLCNEKKEGQRENEALAPVAAGTTDRATNSLGDFLGLPKGSADDDPGPASEDTESQSDSESEEDEEVEDQYFAVSANAEIASVHPVERDVIEGRCKKKSYAHAKKAHASAESRRH